MANLKFQKIVQHCSWGYRFCRMYCRSRHCYGHRRAGERGKEGLKAALLTAPPLLAEQEWEQPLAHYKILALSNRRGRRACSKFYIYAAWCITHRTQSELNKSRTEAAFKSFGLSKTLHLHPQAGWHPTTCLSLYLWCPLAIKNPILKADELWCGANGNTTVWAQPGDSYKAQTTFPVRALQKPMSPQSKTSKAQSS